MEVGNPSWFEDVRRYGFAAVSLKGLAAWAQKNALRAMPVSLGCCSCFSQMRQAGMTPVFNPHHADVLIVAGALSNKAAPAVRRIYEQMPSPKYVIAVGSCADNGGIFADSYAVVPCAADILPVDVSVPGCPPSAEDFIRAVKELRRRVGERVMEG